MVTVGALGVCPGLPSLTAEVPTDTAAQDTTDDGVAVFGGSTERETPDDAAWTIPPPLADLHHQDDFSSVRELEELLVEVAGERYEIRPHNWHQMEIPRLSGGFRFRDGWPSGKALRIALVQADRFELYATAGNEGYLLKYHPDFHDAWALYRAQREADRFRLVPTALLATDNGRYRQSGRGTVVFHRRNGRLVLTRGEAVLLEVPQEIDFDTLEIWGTCLLRGLDWMDDFGVPDPPTLTTSVYQASPDGPVRLAELPWEIHRRENRGESQPGELIRGNDGSMALTVDERSELVMAVAPLADVGAVEYVFQLTEATPQSGVALLDAEKRPVAAIGFFRHRETGGLLFDFHRPERSELERSADTQRRIAPLTDPPAWFRLTVAGGCAKWFVSPDGRHWSLPGPVSEGVEHKPAYVAMYVSRGDEPRGVRVRCLRLGVPTTMARLAARCPSELIPVELGDDRDYQQWQMRCEQAKPDDISDPLWQMACTWRLLLENSPAHVGRRATDDFLTAAIADRSLQLEELCAVVSEVGLLAFARDWGVWEQMQQRIERLSVMLGRRGLQRPFTQVCRVLDRTPFWTDWDQPLYFPAGYRHELFALMAEGDDAEVAELCARVANRFPVHEMERVPPDVRQMHRTAAARVASRLPAASRLGVSMAPERMPPGLMAVSKEAFNVLAEVRASLADEGYQAAARTLVAATEDPRLGLLPDEHDPSRRISFALWLRELLARHPELGEAARGEYAASTAIRLREAMAQGDEAMAERIARQGFGLPAAAEAALWLGDRNLALGRFAEAASWYSQAGMSDEFEAVITERRLLLAETAGEPALRRSNGGRVLPLVEATWRGTGSDTSQPKPAQRAALPPGQYRLAMAFASSGVHVRKPNVMPDREFDWAGRQIALRFLGEWAVVCNQVELAAIDPSSGVTQWSQWSSVEDSRQEWPAVWMRPETDTDRVVARRLDPSGPQLVCVDSADGRMLWSDSPGDYAASDPWRIGGCVYCVSALRLGGAEIELSLAEVDVHSGAPLATKPLVRFRDVWDGRLTARVTRWNDKLVVTAGDLVLGCDLSGEIYWLRRIPWIGPEEHNWWAANTWIKREDRRPLVIGGRAIVAPPGSWCVTCVDARSGELLWQHPEGTLRGVLGAVGETVLVQTGDGFLALDARTGDILWDAACQNLADAAISADGEYGIALRRAERPENRLVAMLQWFRTSDGAPVEEAVLGEFGKETWFGPLAFAEDAVYLAIAEFGSPAARRWYRLVPRESRADLSAE